MATGRWGPVPASFHMQSLISLTLPLWGRKPELCWLLHYLSISFLPFFKKIHFHVHKICGVVNKIRSPACCGQVLWTNMRERQMRPSFVIHCSESSPWNGKPCSSVGAVTAMTGALLKGTDGAGPASRLSLMLSPHLPPTLPCPRKYSYCNFLLYLIWIN